jgi:hypothetical protein
VSVAGPPAFVSSGLPNDLVRVLGLLHEQPAGAAEVVMSGMTWNSLVLLVAMKVIAPIPLMGDGAVEIKITDYGYGVIEECANRDPDTD